MKQPERIIQAWLDGRQITGKNVNFWTDGQSLYSYLLCIGEKDANNNPIIWDYTKKGNYVSPTTGKHVNVAAGLLCARALDYKVLTPVEYKEYKKEEQDV